MPRGIFGLNVTEVTVASRTGQRRYELNGGATQITTSARRLVVRSLVDSTSESRELPVNTDFPNDVFIKDSAEGTTAGALVRFPYQGMDGWDHRGKGPFDNVDFQLTSGGTIIVEAYENPEDKQPSTVLTITQRN